MILFLESWVQDCLDMLHRRIGSSCNTTSPLSLARTNGSSMYARLLRSTVVMSYFWSTSMVKHSILCNSLYQIWIVITRGFTRLDHLEFTKALCVLTLSNASVHNPKLKMAKWLIVCRVRIIIL